MAFIFNFGSILTNMGNFLIVNQAPQKSDVIIILNGDSTGRRVAYGAELYHEGYAYKILLTGAGEVMMQQALSQGISESDILLEAKSTTTFENAEYSLKIAQNQGYKSAIVVTSPYHTRRSSIIFTKFFKGIDLTICPVPYDPAMAQSWWKDSNSREFVISEYLKLVWHYLFEWH